MLLDYSDDAASANADFYISPNNITLPKSVDWRRKGAVTHVKDQGYCGSCWSFASTGVIESHHFIKHGQLLSLSEQNLVDCTQMYGNHGCHGGYPSKAFQYIRDYGGIDTEQSYPYRASDGSCGQKLGRNSGVRVQSFVTIPRFDERKLQEVLATIGPVAVCIDASNCSFQLYQSGIYYEPYCNPTHLDHAVLVVGYGTDEHHQDYYIVKNR